MSQPFVPLLVHIAAPLTATPMPAPEATPPSPPVDLDTLRAEAYLEGQRAAQDALQPKIDALAEQLASVTPLVEQIAQLRKRALDEAARDVTELVVALARKVLGDALTVHPDALARLVHDAIARLPDEDEIWIRVPLQAVDHIKALLPERHRAHVLGDGALEKGCVVETRHASIDASLETAIAGLSAATAHWLASRS